eukprot:1159156-Pelagomonas_calceolata.AAC.10
MKICTHRGAHIMGHASWGTHHGARIMGHTSWGWMIFKCWCTPVLGLTTCSNHKPQGKPWAMSKQITP